MTQRVTILNNKWKTNDSGKKSKLFKKLKIVIFFKNANLPQIASTP
jgi:hypothetical protein